MSERELVEVFRAKDSPQAHMLRAALEEAGIAAAIQGDLLEPAWGELDVGWSGAPRIMVASGDAATAREIIARAEAARASRAASSPEAAEIDTCLACGARMADGDEKCPACGWSYKSG
jgi:rubrerythrin